MFLVSVGSCLFSSYFIVHGFGKIYVHCLEGLGKIDGRLFVSFCKVLGNML